MKSLNRHLVLVTVICAFGIMIGSIGSYAGINDDLIDSARVGDTDRVKALLEKGADINAKNKDGITALMAATTGGHNDTISFLKEHNAIANEDQEMQQDSPTEAGETEAGETKAEEKVSAKKGAKDDPAYWLDKGAICATYGNDKAAIIYFKKAIGLDSDNTAAYFNLGICYGETGQYEKALMSINKAIDMCPEKASFFYGRGRVYLLSGDKEKAIEDFKRSAELGNPDTQDYLQNTLHISWDNN